VTATGHGPIDHAIKQRTEQMNEGQPRHGGTLRLYGPADMDRVDPMCCRDAPAYQITRLFARQLFTYQPEADLRDWRAIAPVPDLATFIPSTYNTGMGASHLNNVLHLRPGAFWDTTPPRPVTAHDVVRGLKRMCNPVLRPAALPYFTSTIRGMAGFCDEYAAAVPGPNPAAAELAAFQNSHEIPGVFVLDDESLVIELARPATDLVNILALPCASPAPVEYDAFVPGSPELARDIRSNGPYRVTRHVPGKELLLEPNPAWHPDSDPVRHRHLDAVHVTMEKAGLERVARKIASGAADLPWGSPNAEPYDAEPADPGTGLGYALDPYLVLNLKSPALGDVRVRRAIAYAIDKAAIAAIYAKLRTGSVTLVAGSVVPPGNDAHQALDLYATPGGGGDPEKCRALLAEAGHPDGLAVTAVHPDTEPGAEVAQSYAADLEKAGITVRLVALGHAAYHDLLREPARAGEWDLAALSMSPAWFHGNGRVFLQPMFQTNPSPGTGNPGQYSDPGVDLLIDRALASMEEPARADAAWREAERRVLEDAAVVPILFQTPAVPGLRGPRVREAIPMPAAGYGFDLSALWLDE
jgi:peptide/nickel transport system substrate-binding protein